MCQVNSHKIERLDKDLTTYKVYVFRNNLTLHSIHQKTNIPYKLNKTYSFKKWYEFNKHIKIELDRVYEGFHSFLDKDDAYLYMNAMMLHNNYVIVECQIPKGTRIIKGLTRFYYYGDRELKSVVSEKIKILKIITD